jgi:hypothetical protein
MKEKLSKNDVGWTYLSKFFSLLSGLVTLPLILRMLSNDEISLNYIFLNVTSFIFLFDFGFSSQFSKCVAFAFGGSCRLSSVGFESGHGDNINYRLIKSIIKSAQYLYLILASLVFLVLLIGGSYYISIVTRNVTSINVFYLWISFSAIQSVDFYFKFYTPLICGKGLIAEVNRIDLFSNVIKVFLTILLLMFGLGLWSIILGIFFKLLFVRCMSIYELFYRDNLVSHLNTISLRKKEIFYTLNKIWYNAKRVGLVQLSTFISTQLGFFLIGIYVDFSSLASYGLLMQLCNIISSVSLSLGYSSVPLFSQFRAEEKDLEIKKSFYFSMGMFYYIYILGSLFLLFIVPFVLPYIKSNVSLPQSVVIFIYLLYKFLEGQHCLCICCLSSKNIVYDLPSAPIIGILSFIVLFVGLKFFSMGLLYVVLSQLLLSVAYPNWKWPYELCKDFHISFSKMIIESISSVFLRAISFVSFNYKRG